MEASYRRMEDDAELPVPLRDGDTDDQAPEQGRTLTYAISVLLGAGTLGAYNTLVTAGDYLDKVYPDANIEYLIPLVVNVPSLVCQVLMLEYGRRFSFSGRVTFWFLLEAVLLVAMPLYQGHVSEHSGLIITMAGVFLIGTATSILNSTIFGFSSFLPSECMGGVMVGQSAVGLGVSVIRIITKGSFPDDEDGLRRSALIYFAISALMTVVCVAGYFKILTVPFARYYLDRSGNEFLVRKKAVRGGGRRSGRGAAADDDESDAYVTSTSETGRLYAHVPPSDAYEGDSDSGPSAVVPTTDGGGDGVAGTGQLLGEPKSGRAGSTVLEVISQIWLLVATVFCIFVVTFLVFPGMVYEMNSNMGLSDGWYELLLVTEFNLFDLTGRVLAGWRVVLSPGSVWKPTAARLLLVPLFVLCIRPRVFSSDFFAYGFMSLFGVSNGYLASVCMMFGPQGVAAQNRERAGYTMSLFLNIGIIVGSALALLLHRFGVGVA